MGAAPGGWCSAAMPNGWCTPLRSPCCWCAARSDGCADNGEGLSMKAQDVMTAWVATIGVGATVREAAKLMSERRVSALPVLDEKDRLVGIVSEGDLVRRPELGTAASGS